MREIAALKDRVGVWRGLENRSGELYELLELASLEEDTSIEDSATLEFDALFQELQKRDFELQLSGPYDDRASILAIHAGAGGTESQDWAAMLLRMYVRWAEKRGFSVDVLDTTPGEEAGIKSAMIEIRGSLVFGYLQSERGVHRLVRLSPFDTDHARHTSFAKVEVMPEVVSSTEIEISSDDLRVDVFRASGHGGQNVQKVATAVRITHIPTGLVTTCQDERSQLKNKEKALSVLRSRLLAAEIEKQQQEITDARRSQVGSGDRSERVRTYNFPQGRVTDHRIGLTSYNLEQILDGDLIEFMEALVQVEQARKLENAGM